MIDTLRKDILINEYILVNFINLSDDEKLEILKWRNDENIRKWMFNDKIIEAGNHLKFIENLKTDDKNFYWRVSDNAGLKYGVISLNKIDMENGNSYLGIYKNPDLDKAGAGMVLMKALFHAAFKLLGLHALKLEVTGGNERAINFYHKAGFCKEGRLREFLNKDGRRLDVVVMGIMRGEADHE
jgi:UDP-4-amino-4,6-dideoxy-N-acetyl-beta-L-altrosamine N-acetyltransferase